VLFSEPKIPQWTGVSAASGKPPVSVLFSEPKIPQYSGRETKMNRKSSFSALQRAENSSTRTVSALLLRFICFSALQRAENSSIFLFR